MGSRTTSVLIKIGLFIAAVLIVVMLVAKRYVYFQPKTDFLHTHSSREDFEDVQHGHLHGRMFRGDESNHKLILYCHGNQGNLSYYDDRIDGLNRLGYSILIFDYSGYGKSSGVPSEQQCYDDVSTMLALVRQQYAPGEVILYGFSMGAVIAAYAARRYGIDTLILEAPLPSIASFIENKLKPLCFLKFLFNNFDLKALLDGRKGRTLLMYSNEDEIISAKSVIPIQRYATETIVVPGPHNSLKIPYDQVQAFIEG